jgi:RimJ/RimL family protein N-acetyltransferase
MKKLIKRFRIIHIDAFIYKMDHFIDYNVSSFKYQIEKSRKKNKWCYTIKEGDTLVHTSYLYDSVFLLKLLKKNGPVIGDCYTNKQYRGQSIYPQVINKIAFETLKKGIQDVFIVVSPENISSIKGIEKAGFTKFASIKGTRWLWFYFKKQVIYFENK